MCLGQKGQSDSLGSFHKNIDPSHKGAEGVGLFPKGLLGRGTSDQSVAVREDNMFILKSSNHRDGCPKYLI